MLDYFMIMLLVLCGILFLYHHFVYPVLLKYLARWRRKTVMAGLLSLPDEKLPTIALIIPVYNETQAIANKINNVAALDYPRDKLTIIFALDGCTDDSFTIAQKTVTALSGMAPDIQIINHEKNRGKIALLNEHIGQAQQDIIALNDLTAMTGPDALQRAAVHYQDPRTGVVCATYRLGKAGSQGEQSYWNYQTRIKKYEAAIASPMGVHGACYFMRRDLWTPLPTDTINDDFVMPMKIVGDGYRSVYDPEIIATESECTTSQQEFRRRIRIGAGNMQQLLRLDKLRSPGSGWLAFLFWSGKGLRPLISFIVLFAVLLMIVLSARGWVLFQASLAGVILLFLLAALVIANKHIRWPGALHQLGYLVEGHSASFLGAIKILSGNRVRW